MCNTSLTYLAAIIVFSKNNDHVKRLLDITSLTPIFTRCKAVSRIAWGFCADQILILWGFISPVKLNQASPEKENRIRTSSFGRLALNCWQYLYVSRNLLATIAAQQKLYRDDNGVCVLLLFELIKKKKWNKFITPNYAVPIKSYI